MLWFERCLEDGERRLISTQLAIQFLELTKYESQEFLRLCLIHL